MIVMIYNNKLNQMTIIYNIDKNIKKLKIFGEDFVKNNKNNCHLLINGKKIDLCSEININEEQKENLEIKLIETKIITNMSYMFYNCSSLLSLPDISEWDTKNVTNMSDMFNGVNKKLIPKKFQGCLIY